MGINGDFWGLMGINGEYVKNTEIPIPINPH